MGGGGSTNIPDSASQKALASIAAQRFNLYQQYYVPLENEFMGQVASMNTPESFENVESYVTALQQPEFQAASQQATQAQARGMGLGTSEGLSGQVDRYYQGMQNIIAMGQGQAGSAISGLGDVGALAQQRGIAEARQSFQSGQGTSSIVGTGLGVGAGLFIGNKGT